MKPTRRKYDFKENVSSGERCYPFHSGEEKDLQSSIKKVKEFLNGVTEFPAFRKGKGTYLVSQVILKSNGLNVKESFNEYKNLRFIPTNIPQGQSNPEDRFIRLLSVWTEAGAISIKNFIIQFEPILINRLIKGV